ncbi:hypothetical protein Hanom_Chr04g00335451 [Helianthus anomalus]
MHDNCCFKPDYYSHFMDSCLPYHEFYQREREGVDCESKNNPPSQTICHMSGRYSGGNRYGNNPNDGGPPSSLSSNSSFSLVWSEAFV